MPPRKGPISRRKVVPSPNNSASEGHDDEPGPVSFREGCQDELWDEEEPISVTAEPPAKRSKTSYTRFNEPKFFKGQRYSGMAIGGTHHWTYDSGQWVETKEEPDLWKIKYEAKKHRNRTAPKGSGAPVGTEYHWIIVAHQYVVKEDANTYSTRMEGHKYKLAHKSVGTNAWSVNTVKGQRDREIQLLEDSIERVKGLPPVISSQKVPSKKMKNPGQKTLDQIFFGGAGKKEQQQEDISKEDRSGES
ncbi:hypothetical protein F5J12DRAFT_493303 [Pisolithus orientalis]|uniref:uncharacterized protein n=1 Tax=Pisolithus orientalis TaxID=936130 RepID=UPI002225127F|nr:uncharacterized protein F5J12DRAFT_493303 [Pisolithus orientalis]KAI6019893.1 hypothetical protein F5J12DRAFT_493303 [Pisolithus orientalis]